MERARPATAADREAITRLLTACVVAAVALRGGATLVGTATPVSLLARWSGESREGPEHQRSEAGRPPDATRLLVGEYEGVVVGLAAVTVTGTAPRSRGLVECCYVEADARGVGVGTALMDAAVAWCAARDCTDVDALALPGDRSTKQRLEAAGFTARLLTLSRRLD